MKSPYHIHSAEPIGKGSFNSIVITDDKNLFVASFVANSEESEPGNITRKMAIAQLFASSPLLIAALENLLRDPRQTEPARAAIKEARRRIPFPVTPL